MRAQDQVFIKGQFPVTSSTAIQYSLWQSGYFNFYLNLQLTFLLLLRNILTDFAIFIPWLLQNSEEDSWWQGLQAMHPSATLFLVTGMAHTMCIHPYTSWRDQATTVWALKLLICYMSSSLPLGCSPRSPTSICGSYWQNKF